ncbi:MAG: tRNA (guanosine(46)-N7)-methyltransferase TrmB [Candidatus Sumerlaeia bacterium]
MSIEPDIANPDSLPEREACPDFFESENLPRPIDWADFFGVDAPVEVEVGCGNGRYLRRAAEERPGHLFFGIERSLSYARKARDRMVKYDIGNACIVKGDATQILADHIADGSVHTLHVYFTDPWPKKRHGKRRLFQTPFIETCHRILRPGGQIFIKVDLFWYFEEIAGRFENSPHFRVIETATETDPNRDLYDITGFEHKALVKKGAVYLITALNEGEQA